MYKNVKNTSDLKCHPCNSWLNHWANLSRQKLPTTCQRQNCSSRAEVGAHISHMHKSGVGIIPLCHSCNQSDDIFQIKNEFLIVSAKPC